MHTFALHRVFRDYWGWCLAGRIHFQLSFECVLSIEGEDCGAGGGKMGASTNVGGKVQNVLYDPNMYISHNHDHDQESTATVTSTTADVSTSNEGSDSLLEMIRPRLLFMSAVYSFDQFLYLQKVLDAMRDHCNAGWNVTIHLQVANGLHYQHPRFIEIQDRLYCYDMGAHIPIILESYGKIGFGLNAKHRAFVRNHINEFDYFSYAEEDMLLTVVISVPSLRAKSYLEAHCENLVRYMIGFFRWEDSIVDSERVSWEYFLKKCM